MFEAALIGLAVVNTGLLTAIFFRLGHLTARVDGLDRRVKVLEGVPCSN